MAARLRIGLAGLGVHGARYAGHLLRGEIDGAELTAVSRSDAAAGRQFATANALDFIADPLSLATHTGLDAVLAVLPPDLHPALALACLDAGRPVLIEKPLAPDAASAARIVHRAAETGTPLLVAQTLRFDPLITRLRKDIAAIGPVRLVALNQRFEPSDRAWIDSPGRGGCALNTGVHGFDLLRYLTGAEVISIQAEVRSAVTSGTDDELGAVALLEPGGILAVLDNARTTAGRSGRVEIVGARGQLVADHVHRTYHRIEGRTLRNLGPVPEVPTVAEALKAFVRTVRDGVPPVVTAADGCAAVEIVEAALLSARLGRRVLVSEVTQR